MILHIDLFCFLHVGCVMNLWIGAVSYPSCRFVYCQVGARILYSFVSPFLLHAFLFQFWRARRVENNNDNNNIGSIAWSKEMKEDANYKSIIENVLCSKRKQRGSLHKERMIEFPRNDSFLDEQFVSTSMSLLYSFLSPSFLPSRWTHVSRDSMILSRRLSSERVLSFLSDAQRIVSVWCSSLLSRADDATVQWFDEFSPRFSSSFSSQIPFEAYQVHSTIESLVSPRLFVFF